MNEKSGGYINRLIVTCLRSGLNRAFRVLQKPERAPIRALRASSSGRFFSTLFSCVHCYVLLPLISILILVLGYLNAPRISYFFFPKLFPYGNRHIVW